MAGANGSSSDGNGRAATPVDAIVVGSGHNGLVAACYLQKAGLQTVVLEANTWIGGCTSTSNTLIPEAPEHKINPCAQDICLLRASTIVADLNLERYGYRETVVDPAYIAPLPDGSSLAFWRDHNKTAEEIKYFSPRDARAYLEFVEMLEAGLDAGMMFINGDPTAPDGATVRAGIQSGIRHPKHMASLAKVMLGSAADAIDQRFEHPVVRGGLISLGAVGCPATHRGSGINAMFAGIVSRAGVSRLIGGTQVLPDSLVACLEDHGGSVRTAAEVESVLLSGDRARGVRLASGEEISSQVVVSACDPVQTLSRFVPSSALPDKIAERVANVPSDNGGTAYFTVDLALNEHLDFSRIEKKRKDDLKIRNTAVLAGSFEDMVAAVSAAEEGRLPSPMPVAMVIPTGPDQSQAPDGQETLYLWTGWMPRNPPEGWDALAPQAADAVIDAAELYAPNIRSSEIGRFVEPWPLLQQRTRVPNGNPYYVDLTTYRNGPFRPALGLGGYTTPIAGLYLSGGGTHPGPSVSGIPGQLAAKKVLSTMADIGVAPRTATSGAKVEPIHA